MNLDPLRLTVVVMFVGLVSDVAHPAIAAPAGPVKVEIRRSNGEFRLYRDGQPYQIKGAVYWGDPTGKLPLKDIADRGGNSVRTGGDVRKILDEAQRLGMTATVNLPMKMESVHKFDYSNPQAEGAYRLFVFVRDGQGNAATANIPFYVKP
jgi:hypothetical protein